MPEIYDSRQDTLDHIQAVRDLLQIMSTALTVRGQVHDESKLHPPEKEIFDEYTPKLKDTTYGSDEYKQYLEEMKVGLECHYANNSHHTEHYSDGIAGMDLLDLVELFCDWLAASKRHTDGDIRRSIEQNKERFGISDQLVSILHNTVTTLERGDQALKELGCTGS